MDSSESLPEKRQNSVRWEDEASQLEEQQVEEEGPGEDQESNDTHLKEDLEVTKPARLKKRKISHQQSRENFKYFGKLKKLINAETNVEKIQKYVSDYSQLKNRDTESLRLAEIDIEGLEHHADAAPRGQGHADPEREEQEGQEEQGDQEAGEDSASISSEEGGAGADFEARARRKTMTGIWTDDEISQELRALLQSGVPGEAQRAQLLAACWRRQGARLRELLLQGHDHGALDHKGRSGLHLAALSGSVSCLRMLLERDPRARAGAGTWEGWDYARRATPLHCAASARRPACLALLLQHGARVDALSQDARTPLHYAVMSDAPACARALLEHGAPADTTQVLSETPLHVAGALGRAACLRVLLEHGARVDTRLGALELTALHLAAEDGHATCARLLLDARAPVNAASKKGQTPLHFACIAQSLELITLLLESSASVRARDVLGRTPLHAALGRTGGSAPCARALLQAAASPDQPDCFGFTPLHMAAINEFSECVVAMIVEFGGDITLRTSGGHSVLSFMLRRTPGVLFHFVRWLDASVLVAEHELEDVDVEVRLEFRPLVAQRARAGRGEAALLLALVEGGRRDLLKHPLPETFLYLKWRRIRKFFFVSLVFYVVFVLIFSYFIIDVFLHKCASAAPSDEAPPGPCRLAVSVHVAAALLLLMNVVFTVKEVFQVHHNAGYYVRRWENWLQWLIILLTVVLSMVPTFGLDSSGELYLSPWHHHAAAVGIFVAWLELMLIIGRFPMFGIYVQMFATVALNFGKFLLAYSCLLVAFGLSFCVLFSNYLPFSGVLAALLKSVIMMSGELEFEDMFYSEPDHLLYPVTAQMMFLGFVLLVTIVLTNLLVGLAVSDIQALQESAGLDGLVRQAGLVQRLEWMLFSPMLHWLPQRLRRALHRGALLLNDNDFSICIRPNDPRENRLPKELIESIYKLLLDKKERAKTSKRTDKSFRSCRARARCSSEAAGRLRPLASAWEATGGRGRCASDAVGRLRPPELERLQATLDSIHSQLIDIANRTR